MPSRRKLWATRYTGLNERRTRHKSQTAAYTWVEQEAREWKAGSRTFSKVTVYVDERDGAGFRVFENCDLAEFGGEGQTQ